MKRLVLWVPLGAFILFLAVVAAGLYAPRQEAVPSNMIGQPLPDFALAPAIPGRPGLTSTELRMGRPHLVNIFASWCLPCRTEAAQQRDAREPGDAGHLLGLLRVNQAAQQADFTLAHADVLRDLTLSDDRLIDAAETHVTRDRRNVQFDVHADVAVVVNARL